jgi:CDP-L-myo-inositol myo-inositolphosphotransferase
MGMNLRHGPAYTTYVPDEEVISSFDTNQDRQSQRVTKAVIIAAGNGSRLQGYQNGSPKPLVKVGGLPLLERVMLSAKKMGIRELVIVIGYQAALIRKTIDARKLGVKITWVRNHDWRKPNGVSVLKAERFVNENFLLFMSDHVIDINIINALRDARLGDDRGILCVDRRLDQVQNLDDATKVRTCKDRMVNLGKSLTDFNAIDVGVFMLTPALFDALRKSQDEGDESLSGGIRVLARDGLMRTLDIGDAYWQDVDTIPDIKYADRLLLRATRSKTDGIIAKTINRRISNVITRLLIKTPVTPNQISIFNLLFSLFTAWVVSLGTPLTTVLGGILFQFASILDGCDGEVATLKHKQSKLGALVDTVTDHLSYLAFTIGVTVGAFRASQDTAVFFVTGINVLFLFFTLALGLQFIKKRGSGSLRELDQGIAKLNHSGQKVWYLKLFGLLHPLGRRDMFSFLGMLLMLTGNITLLYVCLMVLIFVSNVGIPISLAAMSSARPRHNLVDSSKRFFGRLRDGLAQQDVTLNPENE